MLSTTESLDSPQLPPTVALGSDTALGSSSQPICLSDDEDIPSSPVMQFPSPKDIVSDLQSLDDKIEDLAASY